MDAGLFDVFSAPAGENEEGQKVSKDALVLATEANENTKTGIEQLPGMTPLLTAEFGNLTPDARKQVDEFVQLLVQGKCGNGPERSGKVVYYENFCIDTGAAILDLGAINTNRDVDDWPFVNYTQYMSVPLPLTRKDPERWREGRLAKCFNCGASDHTLALCTEPKDQAAIDERKRSWDKHQATKPSWVGLPRYFVQDTSDQVKHVAAGKLSAELCAALGIPGNGSEPPPYLAAMIREGYPPGYVDVINGMTHSTGKTRGVNRLKIYTGGKDMDMSDDEASLEGEKAKTVATAKYPGAFGTPIPEDANSQSSGWKQIQFLDKEYVDRQFRQQDLKRRHEAMSSQGSAGDRHNQPHRHAPVPYQPPHASGYHQPSHWGPPQEVYGGPQQPPSSLTMSAMRSDHGDPRGQVGVHQPFGIVPQTLPTNDFSTQLHGGQLYPWQLRSMHEHYAYRPDDAYGGLRWFRDDRHAYLDHSSYGGERRDHRDSSFGASASSNYGEPGNDVPRRGYHQGWHGSSRY